MNMIMRSGNGRLHRLLAVMITGSLPPSSDVRLDRAQQRGATRVARYGAALQASLDPCQLDDCEAR
jgi:hypothetical protein